MTTEGKGGLANVSVVLVEPQYGGNIGQCARAMFNMGLTRLVLVNPRDGITDESRWMARDAQAVLDEARHCGSLAEALSGATLAIGTTRRVGKYRRPACTAREAAARMLPLLPANEIALVFGREDNGLSGEDLDRCQWVISIPASGEFPSLNLAQAVLICAYELFLAAAGADPAAGEGNAPPRLAGPEKLERFYLHMEEVLSEIRFLVGDQAPSILRTLKRIFGRAGLDGRDLKILHGVFAQIEWYRRKLEAERGEGAGAGTGPVARRAGAGESASTSGEDDVLRVEDREVREDEPDRVAGAAKRPPCQGVDREKGREAGALQDRVTDPACDEEP
jgi:tRNA/rRNA methyltransferase